MGILYYGAQLTPTTNGIFSITSPSGSPQLAASGVMGPYTPLFVGTTLYFDGSDGTHGYQLWKANGATTTMVTNINSGGGGLVPFELTNVNGTVFFSANDGTHGYELWKSDGTSAGTQIVADINPGAGSSNPEDLVADNGRALFLCLQWYKHSVLHLERSNFGHGSDWDVCGRV
jgi:ELWxxDGT repeat protein